jgi:MYXO-CTERM domain-containing protein
MVSSFFAAPRESPFQPAQVMPSGVGVSAAACAPGDADSSANKIPIDVALFTWFMLAASVPRARRGRKRLNGAKRHATKPHA